MRLQARAAGLLTLFLWPAETFAQDDANVTVVPPDRIGAYWVAGKQVPPEYPTEALESGVQGCTSVGYVIGPDGTTSRHGLITVFPSEVFNEVSIEAARQITYRPSETNTTPESVYTFHTFTFQLPSDRQEEHEDLQANLSEICDRLTLNSLGFRAQATAAD